MVLGNECGGDEGRRRERVEERESEVMVGGDGGGCDHKMAALEEEKWRFQAEMLRAECNLLRMEKEIAVKKLGRTRVKLERTLKSAVHSLVYERKKICEEENVKVELEEEIQQLAEKLEKLRRNLEVKNSRARKCHNFDKQAALLQRELKMFRRTSDEICVKKIQEMAEVSFSIKTKSRLNESFFSSDDSNVEILRRKMEGLSNGTLLERMKEECGSMLSTANCSVASSASTSKRIEFTESSPIEQPHKENEEIVCSGRCKAIVRRILEQVRAETEQWSQMQEMLGQVREEMQELQASRDFWEDRAVDYDYQMQSLHSSLQEWREKAISSENKANQLEAQMYFLRKELEWLKKEQKTDETRTKSSPLASMDGQHEMEKRVLVCRLKENHQDRHHANRNQSSSSKQKEASNDVRRKAQTQGNRLVASLERSPLQDISNSCVSLKQHSRAVFTLVPSRTSKNS